MFTKQQPKWFSFIEKPFFTAGHKPLWTDKCTHVTPPLFLHIPKGLIITQ